MIRCRPALVNRDKRSSKKEKEKEKKKGKRERERWFRRGGWGGTVTPTISKSIKNLLRYVRIRQRNMWKEVRRLLCCILCTSHTEPSFRWTVQMLRFSPNRFSKKRRRRTESQSRWRSGKSQWIKTWEEQKCKLGFIAKWPTKREERKRWKPKGRKKKIKTIDCNKKGEEPRALAKRKQEALSVLSVGSLG